MPKNDLGKHVVSLLAGSRTKRAVGILIVISLVLFGCVTDSRANVRLPYDREGSIAGANYRIRVPRDWNGTLVIFHHGYRAVANGQTEPALSHRPVYEVTGAAGPEDEAFESVFIDEGYALAGSSYSENGWAVSEAIEDTLALTDLFEKQIGQPDRILLAGISLGSVVVGKLIETYPDLYDGALALGGLAGSGATIDTLLAFRLAFDAAFADAGGFPADWGTVEDIRDDIAFLQEGLPTYLGLLTDQANFGKFEFVRLVLGSRIEDFYQPPETYQPVPTVFPGAMLMYFATDPIAEIEGRVGGLPGRNRDHVYKLQDDPGIDDEAAYLSGMGVDAAALLAEMNAGTTIAGDRTARAYVQENWEFTGRIEKPILRMHTYVDSVALPAHESLYADIVRAAGKDENLLQVYTDGIGHCVFSAEQELAGIQALESWVTSGVRPAQSDDTLFPAKLGFLHDFDPPEWPF